MKVGDIVIVKDSGKVYANYRSWVEQRCPNYLEEFKKNEANWRKVLNMKGRILCVAPHTINSRILLLLRLDTGKLLMIAEQGVILTSKSYPPLLVELKPQPKSKRSTSDGRVRISKKDYERAITLLDEVSKLLGR
jgi:hypothetical protein